MSSAKRSTISVPYKLIGTFVFRSGATMDGVVEGVYEGANAFDIKVMIEDITAGAPNVVATLSP